MIKGVRGKRLTYAKPDKKKVTDGGQSETTQEC
jgi:hypothetical protein